LHDARAGVLTALFEAGVPDVIVSASAGHTSSSFTYKRYGRHIRVTGAAREAMGKAFGG
jgi:hypothetical protein